jgi:hypothetical protein
MALKRIFFFTILIINIFHTEPSSGQTFNKANFYATMQSKDLDKVNEQIKKVETLSGNSKNAYQGALLMKKAGLSKGASSKLNLFKSGHKLLETSIKKEEHNVEYRFLRLMIQEHAPGMLNYKGDLPNDSNLIKEKFKELPKVVQEAISKYSKESKILNPADF